MDLIGLTEIAKLLRLSRAGADKLVKREEEGFPPFATVGGRTRAWDRSAVEKWARRKHRLCVIDDCPHVPAYADGRCEDHRDWGNLQPLPVEPERRR